LSAGSTISSPTFGVTRQVRLKACAHEKPERVDRRIECPTQWHGPPRRDREVGRQDVDSFSAELDRARNRRVVDDARVDQEAFTPAHGRQHSRDGLRGEHGVQRWAVLGQHLLATQKVVTVIPGC